MENEKLFCSSCGKELTPGTKFCTNCGTPVSGSAMSTPAPTQPVQSTTTPAAPLVTPEQKEALKQNANNLWAWVLDSFKTPSKETDSPAWYSWLVLGLTALFGALLVDKIITNTLNSVGSSVGNAVNSLSGGLGGSSVDSAVSSATAGLFARLIFPMIISAVLVLGAMLLGSWLANFAILGNKDFTFKKALNFFGRPTVLVLAGVVVAFLFALIGVNPLATFFAYIAMFILSVIGIFPFMTAPAQRNMDSFYNRLLAYVVYAAILFVALLIVFAIVGSVVSSMFGGFLGGL